MLEAVSEDLLKSEKTLSDEKDRLAAGIEFNKKAFDRQKATIQEKYSKKVSARPAFCLYPLTHSTFQMETELQELKASKVQSDEAVNVKLEQVIEDHEKSKSDVKGSIANTVEARELKDALIEDLGNKQREEDALFVAIRKYDNSSPERR